MNHSILIRWSEEYLCFVVFLPEFQDIMQPVTHGDSYEEALENAKEVIELLTENTFFPKFDFAEKSETAFYAA